VKTVALIAARMGSSRLPGKSLMPVMGKPMLERLIERGRKARSLDEIVIATSDLPDDDAIERFAAESGVPCFRGSSDDVLARITGAAESQNADLVVELLGDNPLVHANLIDDTLAFFRAGDYDYAASATNEFPHCPAAVKKFAIGVRVEVFTMAALRRCAAEADQPHYREHATSYMTHHPDRFRLGYFPADGKWESLNRPELTFAVNVEKNLDLVRRVFEACAPVDEDFSLQAALAAFDAHPEWRALMGNE
jgi:spore coat polysaccharide biosynthesis protein SpsF